MFASVTSARDGMRSLLPLARRGPLADLRARIAAYAAELAQVAGLSGLADRLHCLAGHLYPVQLRFVADLHRTNALRTLECYIIELDEWLAMAAY